MMMVMMMMMKATTAMMSNSVAQINIGMRTRHGNIVTVYRGSSEF